MRQRTNDEVGDDEPVTLKEACDLFFGSRLSPSALRTEAARGNLDIMQIARKDLVTHKAIKARWRHARHAVKLPPAETPKLITAQEALGLKLQRRRTSP